MKFFKSLTNLVLYFLLCVSIESCIEKDDLVEPKPDPEPTPVEKEYELADNVIELEGDLLKHVTSLKGDTLVYNSNTPDDALPEVGEIVIVTQPTDVFPYGFLGKVTKISNDGNVNVITEPTALDEAFVYLDVKGIYELESTDVEGEKRASKEFPFEDKFEVQIGDFVKTELELKTKVVLDIDLQVDKRNGKKVRSGHIEINQENHAAFDIGFTFKFLEQEGEEIKKLGSGFKVARIIAGPIIIVPTLQPYLKSEYNGAMDFKWGFETWSEQISSLNFDGKGWSLNTSKDERGWSYNAGPEMEMSGSAFLGGGLALEFRFYGNENIKAALNGQFGVEASGEVSVNLDDLKNDDEEMFYNQLDDSKVSLALKGGVGLEAGAKIFFIEAKWEHPLYEKTFFESSSYIFPSFSNHSLAYANGGFSASTNLGRNLLWKQNVGLALYRGDERIEVSEPVEYKFENDFKERNPLEGIFEDIPEEEKNDYSIWSYVKWGDFYIKCVNLSKADVKAVDLGLNVKWASFNLGASSSEDYGAYFAFGEVNAKSEYTMENWNNPWTLQLSGDNDAATHQLGSTWRMPTKEDCEELLRECTWELEDRGNIKGYKITGKTGNSIFLPLTGSYGSKEGKNYEARYRTSEAELDGAGYSDPSTIVMELQKDFSDTEMDHAAGWGGHPIRPVEIDLVGKWVREDCQCEPLCYYKFEADSTGYYSETYDRQVEICSFTWSFDGQFLKLTRNHVDNSDDDGIDISKIVFQNGSRFAEYGSDYNFEPIEINTAYFYRSKE